MDIIFDFDSIAAHLPNKEPQKYMTFITVGNRRSINDTIGEALMHGIGIVSQEAVDAFNDALGSVDRSVCGDDYEFMCAVMKHARAKMGNST